MSTATSIEALHKELHYESYEADLKANPGVFRTLRGACAKAQRDPGCLASYRQLLTQSIAVVDAARSASPEQVVEDARAFWAFYDTQVSALDVAKHEASRVPHPHQEWVEKNLPLTWARFERAVAQTTETGSSKAYEQLRQVAVHMLTTYIEGRE